MNDYAPEPHDLAAERAVLGAMMLSAAAAETCRGILIAADFYRPAHGITFDAITGAMRDGINPDVLTIKDRLEASRELRQAGGPDYLHTLIASVPVTASASYYAGIVREHAVTRRLREAARRVLQWTTEEAGDAHGLTERSLREFEAVRDAGTGDGLTVQTITEFLGDEEDDAYDWVIPDLLERGDRLMLTGAEGAGKSTLLKQVAVMAAAGLHPFGHKPIRPVRVMILDFEYSKKHNQRKTRPLIAQARLKGYPVDEANLWIESRPQRIDIMQDKDLSWLLRQVSAVMPDITFLGPLKNMAPRALNSDDEAAPVTAALDMIRARGSAVVLEAHAGHGQGPDGRRDWRPRGSSAFMGWPEFGYGLRWSDNGPPGARTVDMVSWRGDRDERDWPEMLTAGGDWPWRPYASSPKGDASGDPRTAPWD